MRKFLLLLCMLLALAAQAAERRRLLADQWQFRLDGESEWRSVVLPHDWLMALPVSADAPAGNDGGYRQTGIGHYRRTLTVTREQAAGLLQLYFEGVYMNAQVSVNGHVAGGHPYGYTSFFVDITPYVHVGDNLIEVLVDNAQQKNCRWYTGSGIYRDVWLVSTDKAHIANWGVNITTLTTDSVVVSVAVVNEGDSPRTLSVSIPEVEQPANVMLEAGAQQEVTFRFRQPDALLWTPDTPHLYETTVSLLEDGRTIDAVSQTYGIRTISYSACDGLLLNGQTLLLNGGCVHHDNGLLGAAAWTDAEWRKARLMKEAGFNAVRTSHNAPSEAFLDACDHLGLLVIDEAFDGWREKKNDHDYATLIDEWWAADLSALVLRDRRHPSVFCWSIGNEVIERKKIEVVRTAHQMARLCHQLDPTRPVTSALAAWDDDWDIYDPLAAEHDIVGYNYMIHKAEGDHQRVPDRVMMQTESYPRDAWQNWLTASTHPYVIGDFVWTAMDYLGESGIGRWYYDGDVPGEHWERPLFPWNAAYCGDIDLTGLRKPISHYRSMLWNAEGDEPLYMAVREPDGYRGTIHETLWSVWPTFESWNWPGWEGRPISVEVSTRYPSVRLYLNDRLVGEQPTEHHQAVFTLPYEEGELRAEAGGHSVMLATAGAPAALRLTEEHGRELSFVTIEVVDACGRLCPLADSELRLALRGGAQLLAFGNADIKDTTPQNATGHRAWKGRALAVVRGNGRLSVSADGLPTATVRLRP